MVFRSFLEELQSQKARSKLVWTCLKEYLLAALLPGNQRLLLIKNSRNLAFETLVVKPPCKTANQKAKFLTIRRSNRGKGFFRHKHCLGSTVGNTVSQVKAASIWPLLSKMLGNANKGKFKALLMQEREKGYGTALNKTSKKISRLSC